MSDEQTAQPDASPESTAIRFADGDAVMFADAAGNTGLVEVFAAGQYPQGSLDEQAVAEMAEGYDPARYEAPVSIDHRNEGPAFGWVKVAKAVAGRLYTGFRGLVPEFREAARYFYPRRSIEAYPPDHPSNPTPGKWALKAVSFLGVQAPAVKGLAPLPASFAAEPKQHLTFAVQERRPMAESKTDQTDVQKFAEELKARDEQIAKLSEQLKASEVAALKLAEQVAAEKRTRLLAEERAFCEKLAAEGKLAPVAGWPETLVALRELSAETVVTFAEVDKTEVTKSLYDFVKAHLGGLKKAVEFDEVASDDDGAAGKPEALPVPRGAIVEGADVAAKARAFQEEQAKAGKAIGFAEALLAVSGKK